MMQPAAIFEHQAPDGSWHPYDPQTCAVLDGASRTPNACVRLNGLPFEIRFGAAARSSKMPSSPTGIMQVNYQNDNSRIVRVRRRPPVAAGGAPKTVQIRVPANAAPGSTIATSLPDGRQIQIAVPPGVASAGRVAFDSDGSLASTPWRCHRDTSRRRRRRRHGDAAAATPWTCHTETRRGDADGDATETLPRRRRGDAVETRRGDADRDATETLPRRRRRRCHGDAVAATPRRCHGDALTSPKERRYRRDAAPPKESSEAGPPFAGRARCSPSPCRLARRRRRWRPA